MLFLLSPAKSLDYENPLPSHLGADLPATTPHFESPRGPSTELIRILRQKSSNILCNLRKDTFQSLKKMIVGAIMATGASIRTSEA